MGTGTGIKRRIQTVYRNMKRKRYNHDLNKKSEK